jgi:hypothetical protein
MTNSKNKNSILIIVIVVIIIAVFVGGYYLRSYLDLQKKNQAINDYKKGFYDGLLCQYNCPLTLQNMSNKTEMLPALDCVKACSTPFKTKFASVSYTQAELSRDNLLKDIDGVVQDCKKKAMNMTALKLDNSAYFNCASIEVSDLKSNYTYLK